VTNILIRDVPDDVLAAIDAMAKRVGLSRTEYLRRALAREKSALVSTVTVEHLTLLADRVADLDDPVIMGDAWS